MNKEIVHNVEKPIDYKKIHIYYCKAPPDSLSLQKNCTACLLTDILLVGFFCKATIQLGKNTLVEKKLKITGENKKGTLLVNRVLAIPISWF